jgi:hypothetical protein
MTGKAEQSQVSLLHARVAYVFHVIRKNKYQVIHACRFSTSIVQFTFLLADLLRQSEDVNPASVALAVANIPVPRRGDINISLNLGCRPVQKFDERKANHDILIVPKVPELYCFSASTSKLGPLISFYYFIHNIFLLPAYRY